MSRWVNEGEKEGGPLGIAELEGRKRADQLGGGVEM